MFRNRYKYIFWGFLILYVVICTVFSDFCRMDVSAATDDIVIVLDPGHGGSDRGALNSMVMEKHINFQVAMACKRELEKYEGVKVFLTRDGDVDMTLQERAVYAKECQADLLISMHFNASESHSLFGAETYVPSKAPLKQRADKFAEIELKLLEEYGMTIHGNFTRVNEANKDYYGIIRESADRGIPAVIVEHCYLDREEEKKFYDTSSDLERFGVLDATAVAMTYGLKSDSLQVDYSNVKKNDLHLPERIWDADMTPPAVEAQFSSYDELSGKVRVEVTVSDEESSVVAYAFSKDGGNSYCTRRVLRFEDSFFIEIPLHTPMKSDFIVVAYNAYDRAGFSEPLDLNGICFTNDSEGIGAELAGLLAEELQDDVLTTFLDDASEVLALNREAGSEPGIVLVAVISALMGLFGITFLSGYHIFSRNRYSA